MTVYILQEFIDSHNSGVETNVIGVYDSEEKVKAKVAEVLEDIKTDTNFFMNDIFDDDDFDEDMDSRNITDRGCHLYCDGNGDEYDLYYLAYQVE